MAAILFPPDYVNGNESGNECRRVSFNIDSFTVPLHRPNGRQIGCPLGLCKETVSGVWKPVEIPTDHVIP